MQSKRPKHIAIHKTNILKELHKTIHVPYRNPRIIKGMSFHVLNMFGERRFFFKLTNPNRTETSRLKLPHFFHDLLIQFNKTQT